MRIVNMNSTVKTILGYVLLVASIVIIALIISGWNDCKKDTKSFFINFILFIGYTWELWGFLLLTTAFGLLFVTGIIKYCNSFKHKQNTAYFFPILC